LYKSPRNQAPQPTIPVRPLKPCHGAFGVSGRRIAQNGQYGLRIENQVEVVADGAGFCRFASLTLAPIDLSAADLTSLTAAEQSLLDGYHENVRQVLMPLVGEETRLFLLEQTRPIAVRHFEKPD
jgi:hypothetical protein